MTLHRTFWILSIANWVLAMAAWSVSAYLGIARPTSLFVPTTLFVIGIFAVLAGTLCWVVARFGRPPQAAAAAAEPAGEPAHTAAAPAPTASALAASEPAHAASAPVEPAPVVEGSAPAEAG